MFCFVLFPNIFLNDINIQSRENKINKIGIMIGVFPNLLDAYNVIIITFIIASDIVVNSHFIVIMCLWLFINLSLKNQI